MDHDELGPPGHHGVAVRHAHGDYFVGRQDGNRTRLAIRTQFGQPFYDRGKVRPAVAEKIFNSAIGQQCQVSFGGGLNGDTFLFHGTPYIRSKEAQDHAHDNQKNFSKRR